MTRRASEQGTITNDAPEPGDFGLVVRPLTAGLIPSTYDHIDLAYTGSDITQVVYRVGGPTGTIVGTLTLGYAAPGVLASVTRT